MGKDFPIYFLTCILACSCSESHRKSFAWNVVNDWLEREIVFPSEPVFTKFAKDTVSYSTDTELKILLYTDAPGCVSCRLKLPLWKSFIAEVDSLSNGTVSYLFVFHPDLLGDIQRMLSSADFDIPVVIDGKDEINRANKFPPTPEYQAFLINRDNKVLLVGNPIYNGGVRALYLKKIAESTNKKHIKLLPQGADNVPGIAKNS